MNSSVTVTAKLLYDCTFGVTLVFQLEMQMVAGNLYS